MTQFKTDKRLSSFQVLSSASFCAGHAKKNKNNKKKQQQKKNNNEIGKVKSFSRKNIGDSRKYQENRKNPGLQNLDTRKTWYSLPTSNGEHNNVCMRTLRRYRAKINE